MYTYAGFEHVFSIHFEYFISIIYLNFFFDSDILGLILWLPKAKYFRCFFLTSDMESTDMSAKQLVNLHLIL